MLKVELTARNARQSDGSTRYCYVDANGNESPTLRANPGDLVILSLKISGLSAGGDPDEEEQQLWRVVNASGITYLDLVFARG